MDARVTPVAFLPIEKLLRNWNSFVSVIKYRREVEKLANRGNNEEQLSAGGARAAPARGNFLENIRGNGVFKLSQWRNLLLGRA